MGQVQKLSVSMNGTQAQQDVAPQLQYLHSHTHAVMTVEAPSYRLACTSGIAGLMRHRLSAQSCCTQQLEGHDTGRTPHTVQRQLACAVLPLALHDSMVCVIQQGQGQVQACRQS